MHRALVAYFTERRLPPEEFVCPAQPISFGPPAQVNAASLAAATPGGLPTSASVP